MEGGEETLGRFPRSAVANGGPVDHGHGDDFVFGVGEEGFFRFEKKFPGEFLFHQGQIQAGSQLFLDQGAGDAAADEIIGGMRPKDAVFNEEESAIKAFGNKVFFPAIEKRFSRAQALRLFGGKDAAQKVQRADVAAQPANILNERGAVPRVSWK